MCDDLRQKCTTFVRNSKKTKDSPKHIYHFAGPTGIQCYFIFRSIARLIEYHFYYVGIIGYIIEYP